MRRLMIIGAGYTGLRIARLASESGLEVIATTRSRKQAEALRQVGARILNWDVLEDDPGELADWMGRGTVVVYSIPTLFDGWESAEEGLLRHVEPVARVLRKASAEGCDRFIYLSSTSVYGDHGGAWVDEDSDRRPTSPMGKMRRDIEDYVLGVDDWNTNVVRIVGIYGPERTLDRYIAGGRYKLVDGGEKVSNRVHVEDLARIVLTVAEKAPDGHRAYIASDGHPTRVVDLVDWMVEHLGIERPEEVSLQEYAAQRGENAAARWQNTYRARNRRVVDELGYELRYPMVIDGYRAIFGT